MKREIWCKGCDYTIGTYQGEGHKKVRGELKQTVRCDLCNLTLPGGYEAVAVSMFLDGRYYEWEHEFIDTGHK